MSRLTVKKENHNKGRQFYVCSQSNNCNFFQWFDEIQSPNGVTARSRKKPMFQSISENNRVDNIFTRTENIWPPVMKKFKSNLIICLIKIDIIQ